MDECPAPCRAVSFFPVVHDGELLYSAVERYRRLGGFPFIVSVQTALFGTPYREPRFPVGLEHFSQCLPATPLFEAGALLDAHSLFPVYRPVMTPENQEKAARYMLYRDGPPSVMAFRHSWYRLPAADALRLCPECVTVQLAEHGYTYWLRDHQIPGVTVCSIHERRLVYGCSACGPFNTPAMTTLLPGLECLECGRPLTNADVSNAQPDHGSTRYARLASQLLEAQLPAVEPSVRGRMLRNALSRAGLASRGQPDWERVSNRVAEVFGAACLRDLDAVGPDGRLRLSRSMSQLGAEWTSPVLLVLLVGAMADSVAAFRAQCGPPWSSRGDHHTADCTNGDDDRLRMLSEHDFDPFHVARLSGAISAWDIAELAYRLRDRVPWPSGRLDPCRTYLACVWSTAGLTAPQIADRLDAPLTRIVEALNVSPDTRASLHASKTLIRRDLRRARTDAFLASHPDASARELWAIHPGLQRHWYTDDREWVNGLARSPGRRRSAVFCDEAHTDTVLPGRSA